jgi:hypothetical protein
MNARSPFLFLCNRTECVDYPREKNQFDAEQICILLYTHLLSPTYMVRHIPIRLVTAAGISEKK